MCFGKETEVTVSIIPPTDVNVGAQEVKIKTQALRSSIEIYGRKDGGESSTNFIAICFGGLPSVPDYAGRLFVKVPSDLKLLSDEELSLSERKTAKDKIKEKYRKNGIFDDEIKKTALPFVLLLVFTMLLFVFSYKAFLKYDVR